MAHDQPTYASVPGIRVFGMMCVKPGTGVSSTKRKTPQAPKRDALNPYANAAQTYQTKYPSQYQAPQQQQHYKQPELNAYQQPQQQPQQNYHQQQYQSNYQYLHRTPIDRPLSTSTPRNMYQPMYQQPPASIHTYNTNDNDQYDDVYGRHGAEVDGDSEDTSATAAGDPKVTPPAPTATASEEYTATQDPTTYPTSLASNPAGANDDALTTILATEATVTSTVQQVDSRRKRRNADDIDAQIEAMIHQLLLNTDLAASNQPMRRSQHVGAMFEARQ